MKNYTIFYHDDLDGTTSAAVLLYFFRKHSDDIVEFQPMSYFPELKQSWPQKTFPGNSIIVDFIYHPSLEWWFDHHNDPFVLKKWKTNFKNTDKMFWNQSYPSCCGYIIEILTHKYSFVFPRHFIDLAKIVDVIDSASYKDVDEALDFSPPVKKFNLVIKSIHGFDRIKLQKFLINKLQKEPAEKIVKYQFFKRLYDSIWLKIQKNRENYIKNLKIINQVCFIDLSRGNFDKASYFEYKLNSNLLFTVMIQYTDIHNFHIRVGLNPWRKSESRVNIGELMKKYGGGGHKNVGGAETKTHEDAVKISNKIIEQLKLRNVDTKARIVKL